MGSPQPWSPNRNANLVTIHRQECLCENSRIQGEDYSTLIESVKTKIRKSHLKGQEQLYYVCSALTTPLTPPHPHHPKPAHQHGGAPGPVISLVEKRPRYRFNFPGIARHCSRGPLLSHLMQKTEDTGTARPPRIVTK